LSSIAFVFIIIESAGTPAIPTCRYKFSSIIQKSACILVIPVLLVLQRCCLYTFVPRTMEECCFQYSPLDLHTRA
jgi:hypothetical protein